MPGNSTFASGAQVEQSGTETTTQEDEPEEPLLNVPTTIVLLIAVAVVSLLGVAGGNIFLMSRVLQIVALTAEFLVDSIDGLTDTGHISKEFVGLVLLPIVGNAAGLFMFGLELLRRLITHL